MKRTLGLALAMALALAGCQKPAPKTAAVAPGEDEQCDAPKKGWLPKTDPPSAAAIDDAMPDCDFYQVSYQHFLFATDVGTSGRAAFLDYPTIESMFPPAATPDTGPVKLLAGVHQAGPKQGVLADANGNPVYYSIHVNPAFQKYVVENLKLTDPNTVKDLIKTVPTDEVLPAGIAEYKAAWQVVDPAHLPANMITTEARVPTLSVVGGKLVEDAAHPRTVTVALIAFHAAFTLNNHRELIWASFEHAIDDPDHPPGSKEPPKRISDLAPIATRLPPQPNEPAQPPQVLHGERSYLLFPANSPVLADIASADPADFDVATQKFRHPTPIYRVYPGSRVDKSDEDDAVVLLNASTKALFGASTDKRVNYRLVGAVWLKHPQDSFKLDKLFSNDDPWMATDDEKSILSGESGMSSTAMESFTQLEEPHCFRCHNTKKIKNDVTGLQILDRKLLNVSHVFSRYLSNAH